jgi:4-hydroxy-3-methylbut-2-en-1-yl diphosphate reductase
MKIILAQHFGLCFGVRDAIAQAENLARLGPLTILGELVHNPLVQERLQHQGIEARPLDTFEADSQQVMITAHGASDKRRREWRAAGFAVSDGTCPLVRNAHEQLQRLVAAGYFPIVIGQRGHVEVRGLTEDFPEAVIILGEEELADVPKRGRYGIISQTTQPIDLVHRLVNQLRRRHPAAEVRFVDTVCQPTKNRQSALQQLIQKAEVIVVVGGRHSNNTRELVRSCEAGGRRAIHIERPDELVASQFNDVQTVGVTAGTSTLPETVAAVVRWLEGISRLQEPTAATGGDGK